MDTNTRTLTQIEQPVDVFDGFGSNDCSIMSGPVIPSVLSQSTGFSEEVAQIRDTYSRPLTTMSGSHVPNSFLSVWLRTV